MARSVRRGLALAAALSAHALAGCGGGGGGGGGGSGGGGPGAVPLTLVSMSLPVAQPGVFYSRPLLAQGGTPPYAFRLASASAPLPPGLSLSTSGVLSGLPTSVATASIRVEVTDSASPPGFASRALALQVGGFDLVVEGVLAGKARTGRSYRLSTSPAQGPATIALRGFSATGGSVRDVDPASGTATYDAGPHPGQEWFTLTRGGGVTTEVPLDVRRDPVASMVARFGTTDVWHVAFDGKHDPGHPYATDFHDALARLGLRAASSVGAAGTEVDEIAELVVRVEVLRRLNAAFRNDPSGAPLPGGLAVSFPWEEPPSGLHPEPGAAWPAFPGAWSRIGVHAGDTFVAWGWSIQDDARNSHVENVATPVPSAPLGVFCDFLVTILHATAANPLRAAPAGPADLPALEALLYGDPLPLDARAQDVRRTVEAFARCVAFAVAHEVGHALGLDHDAVPFSIMNPAGMPPAESPASGFTPVHEAALRAALPGPDR